MSETSISQTVKNSYSLTTHRMLYSLIYKNFLWRKWWNFHKKFTYFLFFLHVCNIVTRFYLSFFQFYRFWTKWFDRRASLVSVIYSCQKNTKSQNSLGISYNILSTQWSSYYLYLFEKIKKIFAMKRDLGVHSPPVQTVITDIMSFTTPLSLSIP